jgi:hypothetical protein
MVGAEHDMANASRLGPIQDKGRRRGPHLSGVGAGSSVVHHRGMPKEAAPWAEKKKYIN